MIYTLWEENRVGLSWDFKGWEKEAWGFFE